VLSSERHQRLDRRLTPRFRVVLPVTLENGTGWTRDISASGVYFKLFDRPLNSPQEGPRIKFDVVLEHVNPDGPLRIVCQGEILRVEHAPAYVGMAVRIDPCDFDARQIEGAACERRGADRDGGNKDTKCNSVPPRTLETDELKLAVGSGSPHGESASPERSSTPAPRLRPGSGSPAKGKRSLSGRCPAPSASALARAARQRARSSGPPHDWERSRTAPGT
jgi:PilZ domain-containing protein